MSTQVSSFTIDVEDWFHILDCDAAPAMSTHGGQLRGLIKHVRLFGFKGTLVLTSRLLAAKTRDCFLTVRARPVISIRFVPLLKRSTFPITKLTG